MLRILMYIVIIYTGYILNKKKLIHNTILNKIPLLQTLSLFFLLAVMGYKIGNDDKILKEFPTLGLSAFVIAIFTIIGSVLATRLVFGKKGGKK